MNCDNVTSNFFFRSQHWDRRIKMDQEPWPVGRDNHAAVCLGYGGNHPQLLVTGGLTKNKKVLNDVWVLDLKAWKWRQVRIMLLINSIASLQLMPDHVFLSLIIVASAN